jgi:hypothetical protein
MPPNTFVVGQKLLINWPIGFQKTLIVIKVISSVIFGKYFFDLKIIEVATDFAKVTGWLQIFTS